MTSLKTTILLTLILMLQGSLFAQFIDSVHINSQTYPDEFFGNVEMRGGGKLFSRIEETLNGDTVEFDIYFTRCSGFTYIFYEDTLLTLQNQNVPIAYNLKIRTYYDTNSTDTINCLPFSTPWPIDTFIVESNNINFAIKSNASRSGLKIFPNPVKEGESLSIKTSDSDDFDQVVIYSLRGEKVKTIINQALSFP